MNRQNLQEWQRGILHGEEIFLLRSMWVSNSYYDCINLIMRFYSQNIATNLSRN